MVNQQPIADGGDEEDVPTSLEARKRHWAERGAGQPFGKVIECLRELRPLTRRQLEAASGRSYSQLRGLELGDRWPSDKTLVSIAGPLGFTGSALTGLRDELLRALLDRSSRPNAPWPDGSQWSRVSAIDLWLGTSTVTESMSSGWRAAGR